MKTTQEALQQISGVNGTQQECLNALAFNNSPLGTAIDPVTVKGGVVRVIDSATGDIARTTTGWIEDEKYGFNFVRVASSVSGEFDSAVTRTGRLTLKLSNTDVTGRCRAWTSFNSSTSPVADSNKKYLISLKPSTSYRLNVYAKSNNAATSSVYAAVFMYKSSDFTTSNPAVNYTNSLTGTQDWTLLTITFTTTSSCGWGEIVLRNDVAGNISDAWFDVNSMTLEEISTINNTSASSALLYPKVTAVTSNDNIDQSQVVADGSLAFGGSGATDQTAGMLFIPTKKNGTGITIKKVASTGTYTGDVIISLMGDTASKPSGTNLITPITIPNATWQALGNDVDYTITIPYTFTPLSRYYAIFDSTTKDTSNHPNIRCGVAVAGRYYYNGSVWSSVQSSYSPYIKTLYSKNTDNFTVSTDTQTVSVTAPTTEGWADGTIIDTAGLGVTPLTLAPGVNNIYYSSNGPATADGTVDASLQAIIGGSYGSLGGALLTRQEACNYWAGTTGLSYQNAMNAKALTTKKTTQEAANTYLESL